eukprot:jgi/Mesen1/9180/ME000591S08504
MGTSLLAATVGPTGGLFCLNSVRKDSGKIHCSYLQPSRQSSNVMESLCRKRFNKKQRGAQWAYRPHLENDIFGRTIQAEPAKALNQSAPSAPSFVAKLDDVPHLSQWLPDLPSYENPLQSNPAYAGVKHYFVEDDDVVCKDILLQVVYRADEVRAAIVTCGGLCPGLNTVIREIVCGLWTQYGVHDILGIDGGYRGFYARNTVALNPKMVNDIHKRGGTVLGTSRGGHDTAKIVDSIVDRGINQVYIIGGDGTQRGALVIHKELKARGLKVAVAGIPKTIDNDIAVIDKSFGFDTAVEEAQRAINAAHVEAESVHNGIGLVKLMGRYSGYIALHATLASRDVDLCLIPEVPFYTEGEGGLFEFVRKRLRENGHMVIILAEGAGQELIAQGLDRSQLSKDASGNPLLLDVGLWMSQQLRNHFQGADAVNLKYIDPTYMIRAIPSNASDNIYCTLLAHSAIHGAMAGYTGFTCAPVNNRHAYIPIERVTEQTNKVNVSDRMWARLLSSTQQPSFVRYDEVMEQSKIAETAPSLKYESPQGTKKQPSSLLETPSNGVGFAARKEEELLKKGLAKGDIPVSQ